VWGNFGAGKVEAEITRVGTDLLIRLIRESGHCIACPDNWNLFQHHVRGLTSMSCRLLLLVAESSAVVGEHAWLHIARARLVAGLVTTCRRILAGSRLMRMLLKEALPKNF
jgi:hypothetical protein